MHYVSQKKQMRTTLSSMFFSFLTYNWYINKATRKQYISGHDLGLRCEMTIRNPSGPFFEQLLCHYRMSSNLRTFLGLGV